MLPTVFFILFLDNLHAQDSIVYKTKVQTIRDTVRIEEVVITGLSAGTTKNTSLNIEPVSIKEMETKNPANLSDALAKVPGISQITTGVSISKPVIRGLYGNRILVLLSGLRFDNQQWQDEHGLGLSYIG